MTLALSFGTFDATVAPYFVVGLKHLTPGARRTAVFALANQAGGVTVERPPAPRVVAATIGIKGTNAADLEAKCDTLKRALARPRQRLVASFQDSRYLVANAAITGERYAGFEYAELEVLFSGESAYFQAAAPTADVRTPAVTLAPNQTTIYRATYGITPAGTAPQAMRVIVSSQSGSPTITRTTLRNLFYSPQVGISCGTSLPARSVLVFDGTQYPDARALCIVTDLTSTTGWWPLADASGAALDFSGAGNDLTTNGTLLYRQDGGDGAADIAVDFDGTTGFFNSAAAGFGYTGNFSIGAWVNVDAGGTAMGVIGKGSATAGYTLRKTAADLIEFKVSNGATVRTVTGASVLLAARWYYVVATFTQATGVSALYVNGVLDGYDAAGAYTPSAGTNAFRVGAPHNPSGGAAEFWNGRIRDPFAHGAALTQAQVVAAMRGGHFAHALGVRVTPVGAMPDVNPRSGESNSLQLDLSSASALTTPIRLATLTRAAWE